MRVVSDDRGFRTVVAARAFAADEVILEEEPCFFFAGPLARAATLGMAALDACGNRAFLEHFAVPARLLEQSTWAACDNPVGPDGGDVVRVVRDMLAAPGAADARDRLALALALVANAHPSGDGTGLFAEGAMFNHCCLSSNVRTRAGSQRVRIWFAARDIAAGEELNACYIDQSSPVLLMETAQRRRFLAATKLFECRCCDCEQSAGLDEGIVCGSCRLPFAAGGACGACGAAASAELREQAWKVFGLICGGSRLEAVPDRDATELLQRTQELFGPHHWAGPALGLALLSRPSLFASIAPHCLPRIAFARDGHRRLARVALSGTAAQLERAVAKESRGDALGALAWLGPLLQQCRDARAFREPREYRECEELLATVDKTLRYAADPAGREACCVACAMAAHGPAHEVVSWGEGEGGWEGLETGEEFEVTEAYDDIIL